ALADWSSVCNLHVVYVALAVDLDDLGPRGPLARRLEIGAGGIEKLPHHRIFRIVAGDFGVNVDVDGADLGKVYGQGTILKKSSSSPRKRGPSRSCGAEEPTGFPLSRE